MFTTDMRPTPKTFADLKSMNYTLYVIDFATIFHLIINFIGHEEDRPLIEKINFMDAFKLFFEMKQNNSLKAALMISENEYKGIKAFERNIPKIIEETIDFGSYGVCVSRNTFAFNIITHVTNNLVEFGIIQNLNDFFINHMIRPLADDPSEPSVFNIWDLEFGFITWLIACGISVFAFFLELLISRIRKMIENLVEFLLLLFIFKRFLRDHIV